MYSISDLSVISGIKPHTIRIWEKRYNLLQPERTDTNFRFYDELQLKRLLNIAYLKKNNIKISKIAQLSDKELCETVLHLANEKNPGEIHYEEIIAAMLDFNESRIDKIINHLFMIHGFEKTVEHILIPFYKRLTFLWQTKAINNAHLRFILHVFKKKLMVAVDNMIAEKHRHQKRILFFLPENEFIELDLLFNYYLAKKSGHNAIYLGCSICNNGLLDAINKTGADYLVSCASNTLNFSKALQQITNLVKKLPEVKPLYLRVDKNKTHDIELPDSIKFINHTNELRYIFNSPSV